MSDPFAFTASTPRFTLPLLFVGQSQKEIFVNESLSRLDSLTHCAIEAVAAEPPASPAEVSGWLIADEASGEWTGQSGKLAFFQSGQWLFIDPKDGMQVHDLSASQDIRRIGGQWVASPAPTIPDGGSTIDSEARQVLGTLIDRLRQAGILGPS